MAVEKLQYTGYGHGKSDKTGNDYYMIYFQGQTIINKSYDSADTPRVAVFVTKEEQLAFRNSHKFKEFVNVYYQINGNKVNYSLTEQEF